jgi:HEAT repeat protein
MRRLVAWALAVVALSGSTLLAAAPPNAAPAPNIAPASNADGALPYGVTNARVERRAAATGLDAAVQAALASRRGPLWIGWTVPTNEKPSSCCWSDAESRHGSCRCRLEGGDGHGVFQRKEGGTALEGSLAVRVLLRGSNGRIERVRAFAEDCALDVGGLPFVWLEGVKPAESVALLATLASSVGEAGEEPRRLDSEALAAIAFHADPSADTVLERFVAAGQPLERRRQAAFWMGQARGARGYAVLARLVREDEDPRLREHAIFALSQSSEPKAVDVIIDVAKRDANGHVRGQALFWLAQTAARRAPGVIQSALEHDPEIEVKKKAVFALSQLPREEGVPLLIGLARTHKNGEVRKQAMFWLGQSGDPRALAFFQDVLGR